MTDLTMLTGQFVVEMPSQPAPRPDAAQRFEAMLDAPANADVYTTQVAAPPSDSMRPVQMPQELFKFGNDLSSQMRTVLEKPSWSQTIDIERFPELAVAQQISAETRQFMLLDMQIHFVSKAAEVSEKGLQTLYKQQG